MPQPAGCTVQKHAQLSISHRFFRCFPVCVAFPIGFCSVLAISRLSAHAGFDLHLSFNSVRGFGGGGWGGGGVMTSMRLRLVFSFSFVDLLLPLLVAIVLVVISGYLLLGFPHVDHAKTSSFCGFPDQNFEKDAKIERKSTKSIVFATLSQKCYQKTRTKSVGKRKHRHIVLLTKTWQNTRFS